MSMLLYSIDGESGVMRQSLWHAGAVIPPHTLWIDMFSPTREEELAIEEHLGMDIPTREEMREIELSNRLYQESAHLFMTATVLANFDTAEPENHAVTFILCSERLIIIRYTDPVPFRIYPVRLLRNEERVKDGYGVFLGLLEAIINRAADILEAITLKADGIAKEIFSAPDQQRANYSQALIRIGQCGDVASKARESLTTLWRLVSYAQQNIKNCTPALQATLTAHNKDISALSDHAAFISNKVAFLLDATLGMISIDQNNVIKIFSIAAVVFLPPTLVASVYGMNFHHMPELDWHLGYPLAIVLMLAAAILPLWYFKHRKWL